MTKGFLEFEDATDRAMARELTRFEREIATPLERLHVPRPCMRCERAFTGPDILCAICLQNEVNRYANAMMDRDRAARNDGGTQYSTDGRIIKEGE